MDLAELLATMTTDEGLSLALIVGRDGLLIESQSRGSMDTETLGAIATRALFDLERLGRVIAGGNLSQVRMRFDSYQLLVETLTPNDILVAGVPSASAGDRLLDVVARFRQPLQQTLNGL